MVTVDWNSPAPGVPEGMAFFAGLLLASTARPIRAWKTRYSLPLGGGEGAPAIGGASLPLGGGA